MSLFHLLSEPLSYDFMWRGLLAATMVGVVGPVLGTYVILRGMAFLGDALAHIILPGVVLAYLLDWPLTLGALLVGVAAALGINILSRDSEIREDTAIGIIFAASFALGIVMISTVSSYAVDLSHILFGNILGVSKSDLWITLVLSLIVVVTIVLFYKELLVLVFDPTLAVVLRLPASFLHHLLSILIAITIVTSLQTVGVALVLAMLVTPAATAQLLTTRLPVMMFLSAGIGLSANLMGLYLSFYFNLASGPAMVLVATAIFGVVFCLAPRRGLFWQWRQKQNVLQ